MKPLFVVILILLTIGCGTSDDTQTVTSPQLQTNMTAKDDSTSVSKDNSSSVETSEVTSKTDGSTEPLATTSSSLNLTTKRNGKSIQLLEGTEPFFMEFHEGGNFYIGNNQGAKPAVRWQANGNRVKLSDGENSTRWEGVLVFSNPTLSPGSHVIRLASENTPEGKGAKLPILNVADIPPPPPANSPLPLTISTETTYITEPLRKNGFVDYVGAINALGKKGVTAENNAFIPLYELVSRKARKSAFPSNEAYSWFFEELGTPVFNADVQHKGLQLRSLSVYANQLMGRIEKQRLNTDTGLYELTEPLKSKQILFVDRLEKNQTAASFRPWTREEFPHLNRWLEYNAHVLAHFRRATLRTRFYNPLVKSEAETMQLTVAWDVGSGVKILGQAALLRAMLHLGEGRTPEAIEDTLAVHRLGRLMYRNPTINGCASGLATEVRACRTDMLIAHHGELTLEQLTNWRQRLINLGPLPKWMDAVNVYGRYQFLDGAQSYMMYGPRGLATLSGLVGVGANVPGSNLPPKEWLKIPFNRRLVNTINYAVDWDQVLEEGNNRIDLLIAAGRKSTCAERRQAKDAWIKQFSAAPRPSKINLPLASLFGPQGDAAVQHAITDSFINILSKLFLSSLPNVIDSDDEALMKNYLVGLSLSLAHYRLEQGQYPDKLTDLMPQYTAKVIDDFFVEKPLHYERQGTGYLLYSVGKNGKDDGGDEHGDIVFHAPSISMKPKPPPGGGGFQ